MSIQSIAPRVTDVEKKKKAPSVDSAQLSKVVEAALQAAAERSKTAHSPNSPTKAELQFRFQQMTKSPKTPPANKPLKEKPTPRTEAAQSLEKNLTLTDKSARRILDLQDKKPDLAGILTVQPVALQKRQDDQKMLGDLLHSYTARFGVYIRNNSQDELVKKEQVPRNERLRPLNALKNVFLAVKNRDFLDRYIIRHTLPEDQQQEFASLQEMLVNLKEELERVGICGPKAGESINFWSGQEGQARAAEDEESLSDSDVPLFKFLFDCWGYIKKQDQVKPDGPAKHLVPLLPILFSAVFADFAAGDVHVYMSSKNDGQQSVINVDSAFWSAELYALTQNSKVKTVNLHLHKGKDLVTGEDLWEKPIDLKSKDSKVVELKDEVVSLSRRGAKDLQIPMGSMREMLTSWKKKATELEHLARCQRPRQRLLLLTASSE